MFKRVLDKSELKRVIETLTARREKSLYLYCNVLKYGVENKNFRVFMENNSDNIIGIYFGDSMHIYAPNGINDSILYFIKRNRPRTIFSSDPITNFKQYSQESMGVYKLKKGLVTTQAIQEVKQLELQDIKKLTDFLYEYSDEYRKTYNKEKLEKQLTERLVTGYCRYFGKFRENEIIGCAFTKAEISDIIIVGGILVSPDCRGLGFGKELCLRKGIIACQENKNAYCFIDDLNHKSIHLHESVGYEKVDNVYKYTILKE